MPIRRTRKQKPAENQRVLCVNIGTERILKPLLVFCIKATAIIFGGFSLGLHYEGHWKHEPHIDGLAIVAAWGEIAQGLHDADSLPVKVSVH